MTKIFFDTEFTGLHKDTTLVSIGMVAETGETFYAEFTDYDTSQVNGWIKENVIKNLLYSDENKRNQSTINFVNDGNGRSYTGFGTRDIVKEYLTRWLEMFSSIEMWSDCLAYDWVLFNNLFGTAFDIPKNVYYIPFDICTLFKIKGIDPDISREKFGCGEMYTEMPKHNAMWDAQVIKMCYDKLMQSV
jgi:hypothetical protein